MNHLPDGISFPTAARLGAWWLGVGAVGLLATCICYVLAGPVSALPGGATSLMAALSATPGASGWMRAAGLFGMPSDVLLTVGALLIALHEFKRGATVAMSGWLGLAASGVIFTVVDALVAAVLPVVAAQADAASAYPGWRALFDTLFVLGTWAAGLGAVAAAWQVQGLLFRWTWVGRGLRAAGVVALTASSVHALGGPSAPLIGPGIALIALAALAAAVAYGSETADLGA